MTDNIKDDALLPCPFCGGDAGVVHDVFYTVACKQCRAGINTARNQDYKAIEVWNTRTPDLAKMVDDLRLAKEALENARGLLEEKGVVYSARTVDALTHLKPYEKLFGKEGEA